MITFTKMVATGNDFIVVDTRSLSSGRAFRHPEPLNGTTSLQGEGLQVPRRKGQNSELGTEDLGPVAQRLCERRRSIGADGLLVIEDSGKADCRMRVFNPDGTEVDMCGNGVRCVALYVSEAGCCKSLHPVGVSKLVKIETKAGIIAAEIRREDLVHPHRFASQSEAVGVKIKMTDPEDLRLNFDIEVEGVTYKVNFVNTGVPHVVYFVENLEKTDVLNMGRATRLHPKFAPDGTNVDFINIDNGVLYMRTYERGVEDETLACGTGAVASAIVAGELGKLSPPVDVRTRGGELKIDFDLKGDIIKDVCLEGKARIVYQGGISSDKLKKDS